MNVYVLQAGTLFDHGGVAHENIVAFTTRREAETLLRDRQRNDPYAFQYDRVQLLSVYRTRKQFENGITQRAKAAEKRRRA